MLQQWWLVIFLQPLRDLLNGISYGGAPGTTCDLRRFANRNSDWPIAQLVGSMTYAQLVDHLPGVFEPFPEVRTDGQCASSISSLTMGEEECVVLQSAGILPKSASRKPPPNLVSTVLADGNLSAGELKRALIHASNVVHQYKMGHISRATANARIDPRIISLIGSSKSYTSPELSLGEILFTFVLYTAIVSIVMTTILDVVIHR